MKKSKNPEKCFLRKVLLKWLEYYEVFCKLRAESLLRILRNKRKWHRDKTLIY